MLRASAKLEEFMVVLIGVNERGYLTRMGDCNAMAGLHRPVLQGRQIAAHFLHQLLINVADHDPF
jgi:hypothetical protein